MSVDGTCLGADRWWHDWHDEGKARFGFHFDRWWFRCPECGLAFQPQHAREVGVYEDHLGCLCPKGLGGCGFPQAMGREMGKFKLHTGEERARIGKMTSLAKDGPRPVMRVLPFCPDASVPADGQPTVLSPCAFCDYLFDAEALGRYGCANCHGEGLEA